MEVPFIHWMDEITIYDVVRIDDEHIRVITVADAIRMGVLNK